MDESKGDSPKNPNQINIELSEDIAEGNIQILAMIAHSNSEFVVDFIRLMPGVPKAKVNHALLSHRNMPRDCCMPSKKT